jgi:tetratricopeptide (TPR) repeat protein
LIWRQHFLAVGDYEKAASIDNDTWSSIALRYGEPDLARQLLQETIDTMTGRPQLIARSNMADFLLDDGKLDEAMRIYEDVIPQFLKTKDEINAATTMMKQADLYVKLRKEDRAMQTADRALKLYQQNHDTGGEAQALRHSQAAENLLRGTENWHELMSVLHDRGVIYKNLKQYDEAFECYRTAYSIAEQLGSLPCTASALSEIGELYRLVGKLNEAARFTLDAISVGERLKDHAALAIRFHRLSLIYEAQRNIPEAIAMSERAFALAKQHNPSIVPLINDSVKRQRRK